MKRGDTYSGGGSILRRGEKRLEWTSFDPAGSPKSVVISKNKRMTNRFDRKPTQKEISQQSIDDDAAEARLIRSFVSQCATAFAAGELDADKPNPPAQLNARIRNAGGNVVWLGAHRSYQSLFHKAYCKHLGRQIPIEQIWEQSKKTTDK